MKIAIWGTGEICLEFIDKLSEEVQIIAYIDSYKFGCEFKGEMIYTLDEFLNEQFDFDYIVVASVYTNEILKECYKKVGLNKVIFLKPLASDALVEEHLRNLSILDEIAPGYKEIAYAETGRRMGIDTQVKVESNIYPLYYYDYFRYRTFELVADQIYSLEGAVAEVGVFKGYFARIIAAKFPNTKFYLFDTFGGFDEGEAERERKSGHCNQKFIDDFKNTSVEEVLNRIKNIKNCVVKKGFFPESAKGIEDSFKFVSIDVDFEESIYTSIEWFYPRMVMGGIIFVHDYNEPMLKGVKQAIDRFEKEKGKLVKIPIADKCGTLIIIKV